MPNGAVLELERLTPNWAQLWECVYSGKRLLNQAPAKEYRFRSIGQQVHTRTELPVLCRRGGDANAL